MKTAKFEDIGILPKDSKYFEEAKEIFFFAINNSTMDPALLIAALLNLKSSVNHDEDKFIEGMRQFKRNCEEAMLNQIKDRC